MQRDVVESPSGRELPAASAVVAAHAEPEDELVAALGLSAAAAQRLKAAVRGSNQSPSVAASLLGLATDEKVAAASAELFHTPLWTTSVSDDGAQSLRVSRQYLRDSYAVPLRTTEDELAIGLVDPGDTSVREGIEFALGKPPLFYTIPFSLWRAFYKDGDGAGQPTDLPSRSDASVWSEDADRLRDFERDAPVVRSVDRLFERAVLASASDIHIEQKSDHTLVRFRVDGELRAEEQMRAELGPGVIARIKVLADLDVASRRAPQDGRMTASVRGEPIDMRVATTPTAFGESLVVRLLHRRSVNFELDDLSFDPGIAALLNQMLDAPQGLILVTGPTGSGKTTTLYAALRRLVKRSRKILTIEDPIEYVFEDINQTQVNEAAGVTFASALRAFLRHDPDVILVGEIREPETARLAVQAALTGHLVLATLHTNDAPSAPARLVDMGVERFLLASVLIGVLAQRLAPALCRHCGGEPAQVMRCTVCSGEGTAGRTVLSEAFVRDDQLEELIAGGAPTGRLRAFLKDERDFRTMRDDGVAKAGRGELRLQDALRITSR